MEREPEKNAAVSEIVGEMLMLALVLLLLAVFSSSMSYYLPTPRDPSVTIRMSMLHDENVTLYHKGGDPLKISEISVIIEKNTGTIRITGPGDSVTFIGYTGVTNPPFFDLGDSIEVKGIGSGDTISLATSRAVLFSGRVG